MTTRIRIVFVAIGIALIGSAAFLPALAGQENKRLGEPNSELPNGKAKGWSPVIPLRMVFEESMPLFEEKARENKKKYGELKDFTDLAQAEWALLAAMKDMVKRKASMKLSARIVVEGKRNSIDALNDPSIVGQSQYPLEVPGVGKVEVALKAYPGSALIKRRFFTNEDIAHISVGLSIDITLPRKPGAVKFGWPFNPDHKFVVYSARPVDEKQVHLWDETKREIISVPWDR